MAILNIPTKSPGDTAFASETNDIASAIVLIQSNFGWGSYSDGQYTDTVPQTFLNTNTWQQIDNNSGSKVETYLPGGGTPFVLYDGNLIKVPSVGSTFSGYIRMNIKTSSNDSYFDLGIDIGGGVGVIFVNTNLMPKGMGVYHEFTIPINGFMLDTFFTNGGKIVLRPKTGHTFECYGSTFYISINSQPV